MNTLGAHVHPQFTEQEMFEGLEHNVIAYSHRDFPLKFHSHDFYEINIITSGEGMHYFGAQQCPVCTGDIFIIPPSIRHGYQDKGDLSVHHILFRNRFFRMHAGILEKLPAYWMLFHLEPDLRSKGLFPALQKTQLTELMEHVRQLPDLQETTDCFHAVCADGTALILLARLLKWYYETNAEPNIQNAKTYHDILRVLDYISLHYTQKITLQDLMQQAGGISRSTFLRRFHELCGSAPIDYVIGLRLKQAEKLLLESDRSITDIAYECGFYDCAQFSKLFLRKHNKTPTQFRMHNNPV